MVQDYLNKSEAGENADASQMARVAARISSLAPRLPDWVILTFCAAFTALTLIAPLARAFHRIQIGYNEGWNAYTVQALMHHVRLYYPKYDWTTWNYPLGSVYIVGYLSKLAGADLVFTGRMVALMSLLISCGLVGLIVKKLRGRWAPAVFAMTFCLGLFCTVSSGYVTMDDPTLPAHPFVLAALLLYLEETERIPIAAVAFLLVLGGNIKHNLLPAPIAVALDLLLASWSKALRFIFFGIVFLGAAIGVSVITNGPYFASHIFSPRHFSIFRTLYFLKMYAALQIPLFVSIVWSVWKLRDRKYRIIALYFFVSLLIGFWFVGGSGASENMYFDNYFAIAIIAGLALDHVWSASVPWLRKGSALRAIPVLLLYASVLFAFGQTDSLNLPQYLANLRSQEKRFSEDVAFLRAQPGPAVCESLLRCYYANEPYIYDPYNGTVMVNSGKLNGSEFVQKIAGKQFAAIQTMAPVTEMARPNDRFPNSFMDAIDRYYQIGRRDADSVIYVPRQ